MAKSIRSMLGLTLLATLFSINAVAGDGLVGFWLDKDRPGVLVEMKVSDGLTQGVVTSNSEKPDSVGKRLFRDLKYNADEKLWQGRVFVLKLGEEKDVTVVLQNPDQFQMTVKVGFFSKTVTWHRKKN